MGADPAERRRLHAQPVPPGRLPGHDAARGLLRQVRQGDHDPERHQPRHRQHRRRLRSAQAGRVRDHQDPAARRPDRRPKETTSHGPVQRQRTAFRSVQELQVPRQLGRSTYRRRREQGRRRSSAPPKSSSTARAAIPAPAASRPGAPKYEADHARARRHPRHSSSRSGPTRSGTSAPASARRSRSRTSARTSSSSSTTRPASRRSATRSTAAGSRSTRPCPTSTPTPTPSPSSTSSWRTRAGSATTSWPEPSEPTFTEPPGVGGGHASADRPGAARRRGSAAWPSRPSQRALALLAAACPETPPRSWPARAWAGATAAC